ncbi:MAG: tRNA 2-thiouridine(34) synthase MnmA [Candidatus Hydrogenedentes bacterium]|nr:tRNA 2-thiouridine(34) synthase MnmA [Candidatus Hydrogenedentota bacterium]
MTNPTKNSRVIVAMSGGVDSSVAAALLVEHGLDVVGVTMRVASGEGRSHSDKACCTLDAAQDAHRVADKLGFPHYVVNYLERFEREVIGDFVEEYLNGRTPNPCSRCNQRVKFGALYEKAMAVHADYIATGHYVRSALRDGRVGLRRGVYHPKDQSYTLAGLSQAQLERAIFPLGELTKDEVRAKAQALNLVTWDKPESQEICFVPEDNYRDFLAERIGPQKPGPIVNVGGETVGEHEGLVNYTVGQRRGLGIAAPEPYYVLRIDVKSNTLVVGHKADTGAHRLRAGQVNWCAIEKPTAPVDCLIQIRAHHTPVPCTVTPMPDGFEAEFHTPESSVAPGQWAVLYDDDDFVLAGGIIDDYAF